MIAEVNVELGDACSWATVLRHGECHVSVLSTFSRCSCWLVLTGLLFSTSVRIAATVESWYVAKRRAGTPTAGRVR